MHSDIAISVRGLSKTYRLFSHPADRVRHFLSLGLKQYHREFTALKDVSFDIKKGETIGIIGRNGSGKSTLLQLICGILKPTTGSVLVQGRISALLELGAGFNPEFTGRENVYFQGALMGFTQSQIADRFDDIAIFADIGDFIDQPVRTYSTGMFVRLAFAAMAHMDASLLVIDEALSVGDANFARKCISFLTNFREKGTLIIVSHDLATVMALCDRVIWLEGGVRAIGTAHEVCESYRTDSFGTLSPPENTDIELLFDAVDQRQELLIQSTLRNDLELFPFDPHSAASGTGLAMIVDARMQRSDGAAYRFVVGGELVTLAIRVRALKLLASPVIGFTVRNYLGLELIGDNTYLNYSTQPVTTQSGEMLEARFHFRMPRFPTGEYSICITVAEGVPGVHVIHHRINNAITFRAQTSNVSQVLVGIPMQNITLGVVFNDESRD